MTTREELHTLIDRLSDDAAADALAYVRHLVQEPRSGPPTAQDRLARRVGPSAVTEAAFFAQPPADLATLAVQQGVRPVATFEDLLVDIWLEDEDIDELVHRNAPAVAPRGRSGLRAASSISTSSPGAWWSTLWPAKLTDNC